jgi:hypothetical protein
MNEAPRRRWYQFSIRTMLWLMLLMALLAYGAKEHSHRVSLEAELSAIRAQLAADDARAFSQRIARHPELLGPGPRKKSAAP